MEDRPLTDDELERLTGCKRQTVQARKLREAGIPFRLLPRGGKLWVLLSDTGAGGQGRADRPRPRLDLVR